MSTRPHLQKLIDLAALGNMYPSTNHPSQALAIVEAIDALTEQIKRIADNQPVRYTGNWGPR